MDIPTSSVPPVSVPPPQPQPVSTPPVHGSGIRTVVFALVAVAVAVGGYTALAKYQSLWPFAAQTPEVSPTPSPTVSPVVSPTATADASMDLSAIFELSKKKAGTKIFYSQNLGVGFTYDPKPSSATSVIASEIGNKIYVTDAANTNPPAGGGQSLEVFTKDPALTMEQAIKARFLTGYDAKDCFVKLYPTNEQGLANYMAAGISYPAPTNPNDPFWKNAEKCPQLYSETNAVTYFLMNKDVPGKLIFVWVGQDSITSDGTPATANGGFNWSHSIRILK